MNPLWRVHQTVVDRARGVVAGVQRVKIHKLACESAAEHGSQPMLGARFPGLVGRLHLLVQPDGNTCGSATLVMLKMLRHPWYADSILAADDPRVAFSNAAKGVLATTNAGRDRSGRHQLPWPRRGGTRPAAMIRLLHSGEGFGHPGIRYRNQVIDPRNPARVYDAIVGTVAAAEPVPLYVGDHRWMQHIVLVVDADDEQLIAYNSAHGGLDRISREAFIGDAISVGPWTRPWLAILPR